ncbi:MAG: alpha/beta hydrolase [Gemmatimonadota bacterium]|nr:alpha/beta hydrolase [Gemmatimonadota bacterium]
MRRGLVAVGVVAALAYVAPMAYLAVNERHIVFRPDQFGGRAVAPIPDSLHLVVNRVALVSSDGAKIAGLAIPVADTAAQWLLYLHGNAGNVTSSVLPQFYARWHALGVNVLAIDYRGFGESEDRLPSEEGTYADARAAYDWLRTVRGVPAERIIIYGHSLGSGVATELALHADAAGLIIEGAFTSVPDVGALAYPWYPVRLIASQRFANIDKIGRVAMPKLIMHASDDRIVPYAHGQQLYAAARAPKAWAELSGGHMRAFLDDSAHFWGHAGAFVQRLRSDLPSGESPPPDAAPPPAPR